MALVLIVEDEPQILVLAESILEEAGHETISASSYDGVVALVQEGRTPDIAFIDRNLGKGASGLDVARALRRFLPNIRIIYTSGEHITDGTQALFVEGSEFLEKPYTPDDLKGAVRRQLRQSPSSH